MSGEMLLRLALVPAAVWLASLAARRCPTHVSVMRCAACPATAASVKRADFAANTEPRSSARKSVIGPPMSGSPPR